jgi:hypothetical protein
VECFGGWRKGEPGEARGGGGQHGRGGPARAGKDRAGWGAQAGKDWARGSSTGALCTRFTLVPINGYIIGTYMMEEIKKYRHINNVLTSWHGL